MSAMGDFATSVTLLTRSYTPHPSALVLQLRTRDVRRAAGSINPLGEELNDSRFEVVHRTCNLYAAGGFEIP